MSRSYRKTPITGWTTSDSEKGWKQQMNRRRRLAEKAAVNELRSIMPDPTKGVYGPKDGKCYQKSDAPELMRK